jgi:HEAT repeat protein
MRSLVAQSAMNRCFGVLGILIAALCWSSIGHCADPATTDKAPKAGKTPKDLPATGSAAAATSVAALAKAAATGPVKSREQAIDQLADLGSKAKPAVPQLIEALKAKEPGIRWRAARALGEIGPGAAAGAEPLAGALKDSDIHVRSHAAYALGAIGEASQKYVAALAALITDPDPHVRRAAIRAIDRIHPDSEEIVTDIAAALSAADPSVAVAAVRSLAAYGKQALPAAIKVLRDSEPKSKARYWACVLLAEFGADAADAVEPLVGALSDEDVGIRMQATLALGHIGPSAKAAVPALSKELDDPLTGVAYTAAYALGMIGDKQAVAALKKASLGKDTLLKTLAIWGVAKIEPDNQEAVAKAVDAIISAMEDKRPEVRQAAAQALWDLKAPHEKVGPVLAAALNDDDPQVVGNVLDALASLGERIAPRVTTALEDPKRRAKALGLVQRMGPEAKQCVPELIKLLTDDAASDSDEALELRVQVLMALGAVGPDAASAVDPIAGSLDSKDSRVVAAACYALGRIGPPAAGALDGITKQLKNESLYTRVSAAWALAAIDEDDARVAKQVLPLLVSALDSDVSLVQTEAAETLGALGKAAKSAVPKLKSLIEHGNRQVSAAAQWALDQIEQP